MLLVDIFHVIAIFLASFTKRFWSPSLNAVLQRAHVSIGLCRGPWLLNISTKQKVGIHLPPLVLKYLFAMKQITAVEWMLLLQGARPNLRRRTTRGRGSDQRGHQVTSNPDPSSLDERVRSHECCQSNALRAFRCLYRQYRDPRL